MHDPPGLEVGDRLLDDVANLVDLLVEFFLPVQKLAMGGFPDGREHVVADVSLIADPVAGIKCQKDPGFTQAIGVVPASVDRVRDPCEPSGKGAGDLHIHACGLVLAGVQLGMRGPRPARKQGAVHDVLRLSVKLVGRRDIFSDPNPRVVRGADLQSCF